MSGFWWYGGSELLLLDGPTEVSPGVGELTLEGFAPTVETPTEVHPGVGEMEVVGFAPTVIVTPSQIDTRDKRSSAIHPTMPWRGLWPTPDGATLDAPDREQALYLYRLSPEPEVGASGNTTLVYRLVIRNEDDSGNELVITSLRTGENTLICAPPTIDAQSIDPVSGRVTIGQATIQVIDADPGSGDRVVTSKLTDEEGRRKLVGRKGFFQDSTNNGASWRTLASGWMTAARLVTAIKFEFTVSDSPLDRAKQLVFQRAESGPGFDFSRVSMIVGGPVVGPFGPHKDRGRPLVRVTQVGVGAFDDIVMLKLVDGGGPINATLGEDHPPLTTANRDVLNELANPYKTRNANDKALEFGDLVCRLFYATTGPNVMEGIPDYDFTPVAVYKGSGVVLPGEGLPEAYALLNDKEEFLVRWPTTGGPAQPSVGTTYRAAIFPRTISPQNPLHVRAHPVTMAMMIAKARDLPFTADSAARVRTALGKSLEVDYRITKAMMSRDALETLCFGPFGFSWRQTPTGEYEFITTRKRSDSSPADTIELNDLVNADGVVWEDNEPEIVDTVIFTTLSYSVVPAGKRGTAPIDFLDETPQRIEIAPDDLYPDLGNNRQQFDIPGEVRLTTGTLNAVEFFGALSHDIFTVWRNGAPTGEVFVRRSTTTALLGDEVTLDLPHRPSVDLEASPTSARGSRPTVVQILRRQPHPNGYLLSIQDRGTVDRPPTAPTFTVTASPSNPKKVVKVEITNESALLSAGIIAVRVEMDVDTPLGTAPDGYVFVRVWRPGVDDPVFYLPPVDAGSTVHVRMRSEIAGQLPGTYTTPTTIGLVGLTAPGNLVLSASGLRVTATWDISESNEPVEVTWTFPDEPDYLYSRTLPPGSTTISFSVSRATQTFTVNVRHRESEPFNGISGRVAAPITTGVAEIAREPQNPLIFSDGLGRYGLDVIATEYPSTTVFAEAVETAVGSNTPGDFLDVGEVASVAFQGGTSNDARYLTRLTLGPAPNDGLRRYLKARHVSVGTEPSDYTPPLAVLPWTVSRSAPGWTQVQGETLGVALNMVKDGERALTIAHPTPSDTMWVKNYDLKAGSAYRMRGLLKHEGTTGLGRGVALNIHPAAGQELRLLERQGYDMGGAAEPDVGIPAGVAVDWTSVYSVFTPDEDGVAQLYVQFGYEGTLAGTAWFAFVDIEEVAAVATIGGKRAWDRIDDDGTIYVPPGQSIIVGEQDEVDPTGRIKTVCYSFAHFVPDDPSLLTTALAPDPSYHEVENLDELRYKASFYFAQGLELVAMRSQMYKEHVDDVAEVYICRDGLAFAVNTHEALGESIEEFVMSQVVDDEQYMAFAFTESGAAATQVRLYKVWFSYIMRKYEQST